MQIERTKENDLLCMVRCCNYNELHSLDCPYTQMRWKLESFDKKRTVTTIDSPKVIRDENL